MRFHIVTLGCPKNSVDSEMMAELLQQAGHRAVDRPRRADVLIVNTCGFIEDARRESYAILEELARAKSSRQRLVAAGCLAQRYGDEIRRQVPQVGAIIGSRSWPEIVRLLAALESEEPLTLVRQESQVVTSVRRQATMGATAYLKIADGCDAACAFCAIPLIKGHQQSKLQADIVCEARELVEQGVREIILIAQDTGMYGRDLGQRDALPDLLLAILASAPELDWLRLMYAYPGHISRRLIATMAQHPQICHYVDIPLQHGHPDVLRRMRRPSNVEAIYKLVEVLRQAMPDIALRSAMIVGFPGESEQEFQGLLDFLGRLAFDKVGVFAYSLEDGTAAAQLPGRVPSQVIAERYERAMLQQQDISWQRNQEQLGRELPILIDGTGDGLSVGRSYRDAPEIDGLVLIPQEFTAGDMVLARIVEAQEYDLVAQAL